ncbi:MAG TPA: hypothetical protein VFP50_07895 [Anaeromyxobacteraceae bacterium]|nr:hypothetical protein [Anaeromyxobacteraceae bacterium]
MIRRAATALEQRSGRVAAGLAALVLLAGAAYALHLGDVVRYGDEGDYLVIGGNLAAARTFGYDAVTPTAWRPPGYPFFIAAFRLLGLGVPAVRLGNFAALALSILVLHRLLAERRAALAGAIAGLLVVGYPVLFYAAGTLFPQTLAGFLLLLTVYLVGRDGDWRRDGPLAGLAYGLLVLTVPSFLMLLPVVALLPWVLGQPARLRRAAALVAVVACLVGAWSARNLVAFGRFIPISTNNGINLLQGNSEATDTMLGGGVSARDVDLGRYVEEAHRRYGDDEVAISDYYRREALAWIGAHKAEAARLYLKKCLYYFSYRNDLAVKAEQSPLRDLVMLATWGPMVLLLLARLLLLRRYPPTRLEAALLLLYLSNVLLSSVFYPRIRFRLPFDLLLIGILASFLARLVGERVAAPGQPAPTRVAA